MQSILSDEKPLGYMFDRPIPNLSKDKVHERAFNLTENTYGTKAAAYGGLYTDNLLRKNKMSQKRIRKYIDKVRDKLQEYIYQACKVKVTVEEFCLSNVLVAWGLELNIEEIVTKDIDSVYRGPTEIFKPVYESLLISDGGFKDNKEFLENSVKETIKTFFTAVIKDDAHSDKIAKDLYRLATDEYNNCVINYLCKLFVSEENINKDNCFTYIPEYDGCSLLMADYSTMMYYTIERYLIKKSYERLAKAEFENIKSKLVEKMNQNHELLKAILEDKKFLDKENQKLKKQLAEAEKCQKPTENSILKELNDEKRKNKKVEEKYSELLKKYNELKEMIEDKDADEKEDSSEKDKDYILKEEDRYRRYAFVLDDWAKFHIELLKEFPNATIITKSNFIIQPGSYELVILMPFHSSHSHYYGIKSQCKNKNIKFTHYNSTNIEGLKKHIARVLVEENIERKINI